jgi:hypothetical protein
MLSALSKKFVVHLQAITECLSLSNDELVNEFVVWLIGCRKLLHELEIELVNPRFHNRAVIIEHLVELQIRLPPKKYDHDDWLSWTQADLELNKVLNDYCSIMKARIDELDFELMEELAASNEPNDKLVHELVVGERQAFGNCLKVNYKFLGKSR